MVVQVDDGAYDATTNVYIELLDMNDNIPEFSQRVYSVYDVVEEDTSISTNNRLPIVQVCSVTMSSSLYVYDVQCMYIVCKCILNLN